MSVFYILEKCLCPKNIATSWYSYPPYTRYYTGTVRRNGIKSNKYKGILYDILPDLMQHVCGSCGKKVRIIDLSNKGPPYLLNYYYARFLNSFQVRVLIIKRQISVKWMQNSIPPSCYHALRKDWMRLCFIKIYYFTLCKKNPAITGPCVWNLPLENME